MGLWSWISKRSSEHRIKVYSDLSKQFLEAYSRLKQLFYELKKMVSDRLDIEEIIGKRNQFYEVYQQFTRLLEELMSIDNKWEVVDSKIGFFSRGVTYLFKHETNFDYSRALETLNIMEKSFNKIDASLTELNSKAA